MDVDKVSSHPCHRLSIPAAQLFWCRHCMQKFEDPISRWRHSRSCKTDGPVNHSRRKEKEAYAYQLYVESSSMSTPEPTPLPPPVVLPAKPLAGVHVGASGASSFGSQPSDLSCYICKKDFRSMEEMKAHVREPCNKTKDTSEFPFEVPAHLKPAETSPYSAQARRQRETSRFSTISRKPSVPMMVEPIRVYPRTSTMPLPAVPRSSAVEVVCALPKQVPVMKAPSKELSVNELLSQLAEGGGEVEMEEETLEEHLAKEAEHLLSLPSPPGTGDEEGKENGGVEEEEDEDIFPFHPSKPKLAPIVDRSLEERLEVPEPAANVEISQTEDEVVIETTVPEENPVTEDIQETSCGDMNSLSQEEDAGALVSSVSSKQSDESKDTTEQTKPLPKRTNRRVGRKKPETDTEKENNSKPTETKRKRTSSENDPVLHVKRTRRATQKAEALQEERRLRQRGRPELRKLKKSPENENVKNTSSESKSSEKVVDSEKANSASSEKASNSEVGPCEEVFKGKDLTKSPEGDPCATPQQAEVDTEAEKDSGREELPSLEKSSSETSSSRMDAEESPEKGESEPEPSGSEVKPSAPESKEELSVAPSTDKKSRKGKTDKPVKCKVCDRTFKSAQLLHRHTRYPCKIKHTRNYTQKMLRPKRALPPKPSPKPVKKKVPRAPKKVYKIWPFELKFDIQVPAAPSNRRSKKKRKRRSPFPEALPPREKTITLPDKELLVSSLGPQEQFLYEVGLVKMDHLSAETRANIQIQLMNQRPFTHLEPLSVKVDELDFGPPAEAQQGEVNEAAPTCEDPPESAEPLISPPILEKIDFSMEAEGDSHDLPDLDLAELEPPTLEPAIPAAFATPGSIGEDASVLLSAAEPATTSSVEMPTLIESISPSAPEDDQCASSESMDAIPSITHPADAVETECPTVAAKELQHTAETAQSGEMPAATTSEGSDSVAEGSNLLSTQPDSESELQPQDSTQETTPAVNELQPLLDLSGNETNAVPQEMTLSAEHTHQTDDLTESVPAESERNTEGKTSTFVLTNLGEGEMETGETASEVDHSTPASEKESHDSVSQSTGDNGDEVPSQDRNMGSADEPLVCTDSSEEPHEEPTVSEALAPSSVSGDQEMEQTFGSKHINSGGVKPSDVTCGNDQVKEPEENGDGGYEMMTPVAEAAEEKKVHAQEGNSSDPCETEMECSSEKVQLAGDQADAVSTPLSEKCDENNGLPPSSALKSPTKGSADRHFLDLFAAQGKREEVSPSCISQQTENQQSKSTAAALSVSIPQSPEGSPAPCTPSPSKDIRLSPGGSPIGSINFKKALKNLGTVLKKDGSPLGRCLDLDQAEKSRVSATLDKPSTGTELPSQAQTLASNSSVDHNPAGTHSLDPKSSDSFQTVNPSDLNTKAQSVALPCSTDVPVRDVEKTSPPSSKTVEGKDSGRMKTEAKTKHRSGGSVESSGRKDLSSQAKKSSHRNPPEHDRNKHSQSGYRDRSPVAVRAENIVQSEKQQRTERRHHREEVRRPRTHHDRHRESSSGHKRNRSPVKSRTPDSLRPDKYCNGTGKGENHKSSALFSKQAEQHGKLQNSDPLKLALDPLRLQKSTDKFYSKTKSHDVQKKGSPASAEMTRKSHAHQHGGREGRHLLSKRHRARDDRSDSEQELQPAKKTKHSHTSSECRGDRRVLVRSPERRGKLEESTKKPVHTDKTSHENLLKDVKETTVTNRVPSPVKDKKDVHKDTSESETSAPKNDQARNNHSEEKRNLFESFQPVTPSALSEDVQKTVDVVSSAVSVPGVLKSPSGKARSDGVKKRVSFAEEPIVHDIPAARDLAESTLEDNCVPASELPSAPPPESSNSAAECESAMSKPDDKSEPKANTDGSNSPPESIDAPNADETTSPATKNEVLTLLSNLSPLKSLLQKMCRSHGDVSLPKTEASSPELAEDSSEKVHNEMEQMELVNDGAEKNGCPDKARESSDEGVPEVEVGTEQSSQTNISGADDANAKTEESTVSTSQAEQAAGDVQESNRWNQLIAIITEAVRAGGSPQKGSTHSQPSKTGSSMPNSLETILPGVIAALVKNSPQKMNVGDICRELYRRCQELKAKKQKMTVESVPKEGSPSENSSECPASVSPLPDVSPAGEGESKGKSEPSDIEEVASDQESEQSGGEVVEEGIVCEVELMEVDLPNESILTDSAAMDADGDQDLRIEGDVAIEDAEAMALGEEVVLEVMQEEATGDSADGVAIMFLDEKDIEDCGSADLGLVAEIAQDSGVPVMSQDHLHAVEQETL